MDRDDFEAKNPDLRRYEYETTYYEDYQRIFDLGMSYYVLKETVGCGVLRL